jgi:co-chaperonin GroES (HSP10)
MRADLRSIAEAATHDPKSALLDAAGDLTDYQVAGNLVLVATYIQPEKTKGGILLPDGSLAEDRFQGKVGLVLKTGPAAFVNEPKLGINFYGLKFESGEWVIYRPSDGMELFIRDRRQVNVGLPCRLIEDSLLKAGVSDPSLIY